MTIRTRLMILLSVISLVLVGLTTWQSARVIGELSDIRRSERINSIAAAFIGAAKYLAVERGLSNSALAGQEAVSGPTATAINAAREKSGGLMRDAQQALQALPHSKAVDDRMAQTQSLLAAVDALRRTADAEMAKPQQQRSAEIAPRLVAQLTELIEISQLLRRAVEEDLESARLDLKRLQGVAHLAWGISENIGRERAYVSGLIAAGRPVGPEQAAFLAGVQARIDLLWPELDMMVAMMPAESGLAKSVAETRQAVMERFAATRRSVVAAGSAGQPYPLTAQQWFAEATAAIDTVLALSSLAGERANAMAHDLTGGAMVALAFAGAIGLISLGLIGFAFFVSNRQILAPIAQMTGCMRSLADGKYDITVPGIGRQDEIGEMAGAVQVFKENGIENEQLRRNVENERQQRERDRAEQEAMLDRSVGEVVSAAAEGNLTKRIDTAALIGVMKKLGDGINTLLTSVGKAVDEVGHVVAGIAAGDLTRRVNGEYHGVFGQLKDDVNRASETLADTVRHISEATDTVSRASGEISAGSQDLAQRTESQAASIEETAASMHEITTTVKQNADSAQAANQLATTARETAQKGGEVVSEAVSAVTQIEESARKISDIVGLIDEIAFQTNLLALNASVEAARAGEAGKGFAVVAQEVRALAQRSANASKDIKALIQESNAQVKTGAALVNQTGQSLTEIVSSIKKVSDIVAEIAAASREQATGLEQVNTAVGSMDEMTQRNGALVEETSAAAQALNGQAEQLADLVRQFRIR
ncbi:MAG: methyl-accepting chemotaxis protein [Ferrovibrio sp.]